jgi:DMSO reductase anchor subunit
MKKLSVYWALLVGLLSVVVQVLTYYIRFGKWNEFSTAVDYIMFFLAGTLGGSILIYFLNRQTSKTAWWVVMLVFLLATPVAMFMMLGGGLLGPLGVLIFPQIPWALITWIGALIAKIITRDQNV